MNPNELLRIVDSLHRDKNIDKSIVFDGIEAALLSAARKHYGEEAEIAVSIDRDSGARQWVQILRTSRWATTPTSASEIT